jgi:hypothetical protein
MVADGHQVDQHDEMGVVGIRVRTQYGVRADGGASLGEGRGKGAGGAGTPLRKFFIRASLSHSLFFLFPQCLVVTVDTLCLYCWCIFFPVTSFVSFSPIVFLFLVWFI